MAEVDVDRLGPVDWFVVEFPSPDYGRGQVAPILKGYIDSGLIRILDMLFLRTNVDGTVEPFEISDVDADELGDLILTEADLAVLLSEQDVVDLAETMGPGTSAVLVVWENLWAAPFGSAVRHAGGQLVASGRIPTQALLAAVEADAKQGV